jgi:argininosuccinate lyase
VKAWGGRFEAPPAQLAEDFGRSLDVDHEIALDDVEGSIAHVRGLGRAGILTTDEVTTLVGGLEAIRRDIETDAIAWDPALEDIHMAVEFALADRVGPVAGKLHTARSRNDQVSTDLRLWVRRTIDDLDQAILGLERALVGLARRHADAVMPGHTHVQPAQPVLFAHHLLAYVEMLERDRGRLSDARRRANVSPLGSGAIAGVGFPLDREVTAGELGFDGVTRNSIDASGDRDFVIETLAAVTLGMGHLSRLAEELVWWSNPQFGCVRLAEAYSTGSSMLPNKRNADPAELVRARAGSVIGHLTGVLATVKGLPMGYQRDLQEVKRPLFEAGRGLLASLAVMAAIVDTLEVDEHRMRRAAEGGATTAIAVADALVDRGLAFRSAHHVVGAIVRGAEARGITLDGLADRDISEALGRSDDPLAAGLAGDPGLGAALRAAATVEGAIERCDVIGGTAPRRVAAELDANAQRLGMS